MQKTHAVIHKSRGEGGWMGDPFVPHYAEYCEEFVLQWKKHKSQKFQNENIKYIWSFWRKATKLSKRLFVSSDCHHCREWKWILSNQNLCWCLNLRWSSCSLNNWLKNCFVFGSFWRCWKWFLINLDITDELRVHFLTDALHKMLLLHLLLYPSKFLPINFFCVC